MAIQQDSFWDAGRIDPLKPVQAPDIPGTLVPRSTLLGGQVGPKVKPVIIVDPDVPGQSFIVDRDQINKESSIRAAASADINSATSTEDLRFRASQAFRTFAADNRPQLQPLADMPEIQPPAKKQSTVKSDIRGFDSPAKRVVAAQPASFDAPAVTATAPVQEPIAKPASLFARVNPAPARLSPVPEPAKSEHTPTAPTYKVTIDVKDSPISLDVWYHDVIRDEHVLALCYDTSLVGYPRTRLRPTPNDIAIHVEGSDSIYIVADPNIRFMYGTDEIQIFLIKSEYPYGTPAEGA